MTFNPRDLCDKDSDVVKDALAAKCGSCKAAVNRYCTDIISGQPLYETAGRYVHLFRMGPK